MKDPALRAPGLWRAVGAGLVLFVVYQSLNHQPLEVPVSGGDRIGHLSAYATLMWWHCQLHGGTSGRRLLAIGFVLMGVALEIAQSFTGYRTMDMADAAANAAGVMAGWLAAPPRLPSLALRLDQFLGRLAKPD